MSTSRRSPAPVPHHEVPHGTRTGNLGDEQNCDVLCSSRCCSTLDVPGMPPTCPKSTAPNEGRHGPMRRNRIIAGTSAFLLGVTGVLAASFGSGGGNTAEGAQPITTLAAPAPPSPQAVFPAREVRIAAVGDMNGPKTYAPNSPSGRNGAAIT